MSSQELQFGSVLANTPISYSLLLAVISGLLFFPGLGTRDFWAPGEPIYGEVIRVMFEKNNWLVPMLNGQIYADKPVLYFWFALALSKIAGGVSEWTVRLPAALGGLGLVLAVYHFGKTFYDRQTGFIAGLVLATTSRLLWESRYLRLDTVLSFFLFVGYLFFLKALFGKGGKGFFLGAYACFALASLTKGPIGIILPGLAVITLIAVMGRWGQIKDMRLGSGALLVAALILPWLMLLHFRGEDQWLHDFIWIHNVQNFALKPIGHIRPFYYYFVNLPPDFLPWTLLVPGALIFYYPWLHRLRANPVSLALACWFAAVFIFFTCSKSKIAYYLLPLLPSLALLTASYLKELISGRELHGMHWRCTVAVLYFCACVLLLGGVALPIASLKVERGLFVWAASLAVILVAGAAIMFHALRKQNLTLYFSSLISVLLGLSITSSVGVLPYLDKYKSPRNVGEFVKGHVPESVPVYIFQSTMSDFNYYARRERIPVIASANALAELAASRVETYLLIHDKGLKQAKGLEQTGDIITEQRVGERKWYLMRLPRRAS
jgi:4-amino-4-deoxy-L-arabinose transferase-like glycosyltransferase